MADGTVGGALEGVSVRQSLTCGSHRSRRLYCSRRLRRSRRCASKAGGVDERLGDGLEVEAHGGAALEGALFDGGEAVDNCVAHGRVDEGPGGVAGPRRNPGVSSIGFGTAVVVCKHGRSQLGREQFKLAGEAGCPGGRGEGRVRGHVGAVVAVGDGVWDPGGREEEGAARAVEGTVHVGDDSDDMSQFGGGGRGVRGRRARAQTRL